MTGDRSPRDLNNLNEHKLTRRRVMKAAASVGMSSAAVLAMTPDDVKAADSDQITIPFDVSGDEKKQISADLIEWYYRARDATDQIREAHFHKDGVWRIMTRGGGPKDNPHVLVTLEDDNGKADERRGEIPEYKNGVRVETETCEDGAEANDQCTPSYWSDKDNFPGGQEIRITSSAGGTGTISPRHYEGDLSWFGWTTAAHVLVDCYTGVYAEHAIDGNQYYVGEVTKIDGFRDIAWIQDTEAASSSPYNRHPEFHTGEEILQTVSEEGLVIIDDEGQSHQIYGATSCKVDGMNIEGWNGSHTITGANCREDRWDQMYSGANLGETDDGDSGALYQVEDPNNAGNWYAMGSHSGTSWVGPGLNKYNHYGPQGFTIDNVYNRRWDG